MDSSIYMHEEDGDKGPKNFQRYLDFKLMESRTILISEGVSSKLTRKVLSQLLIMDAEDSEREIRIFLNSPGGSADDGFAIYDAIKMCQAPVKIITNGLCASAGAIILCAGTKENRISMPNTRIMMHQPSTQFFGTAADIDINAQEIAKLRARANKVISEATGQSIERLEKDTNRDFWLSPEEAKEYGLIGRIVEHIKDI